MRAAAALAWAALLAGCSDQKDLDLPGLMDPANCQTCHPDHYREWSGSMHAYASDDPIFRAMNARGQRENGLGDFCVKCHAPVALREGLTTDGLNLDDVPQSMKGVTCFFCHSAEKTTDDHNAAIDLADDLVMRGGLEDPTDNTAHKAEFATQFDRFNLESSKVCGSCHDIVTPKGVELERTFKEWRGSLFAHDTPAERNTCPSCHMQGREGVAAEADGVPLRRVHDHRMAAVDLALTDFPGSDDQRDRAQFNLDPVVILQICVVRIQGGLSVRVSVENFAAGHAWPSGAAQDRRAWVELRAFLGDNEVFSTGVVPEGTPMVDVAAQDPNFWRIGDEITDADGNPVHMFWDAEGYQSMLLPAPTALSPLDPRYTDPHVVRIFQLDTVADRIESAVYLRPVGLDVIDDLIDSGDLDPSYRDKISTYSLGAAHVVWKAEEGRDCEPIL